VATESAIFVFVNIVLSPFCQSSHVGSHGFYFVGVSTKVTFALSSIDAKGPFAGQLYVFSERFRLTAL
jgi:hypothetical protein